jgi:hypothetical protein
MEGLPMWMAAHIVDVIVIFGVGVATGLLLSVYLAHDGKGGF